MMMEVYLKIKGCKDEKDLSEIQPGSFNSFRDAIDG